LTTAVSLPARVDFYVLSEADEAAQLRFACRLVEKAVEQGSRVHVRTASSLQSQRVDDLLWMFSDRSFLPHEVTTGAAVSHSRVMVVIGEAAAPASHRQLLINLTDAVPENFAEYERVAEIVPANPEQKQLSRERYKSYRERGCALESHNI
jgi:DNA polymerase-3 subunit chi